jgi:predicted Zn-dependent protease
VVELSPTVENRLLFAATALRVEKPPYPIVSQTLDELRKSGAETNTAYHLLASQLALRLNRIEAAASHLGAAVRLEPTNRLHQLNLATLRLRQPDSAAARQAREELAALTSDPRLGEHALRSLVVDSMVRKQFTEAGRLSGQLLILPQARFDDRVQHLTVLDAEKSPQVGLWLTEVQHEAATNTSKAALIMGWMTGRGEARAALDWLATLAPQIRTNPPLPMAAADSYFALKDWPGLEQFLTEQNWEEQEPIRLALLARATREQGRRDMADMHWRRALGVGGPKGEALGPIAQMAMAWGWANEAEEALWALVQRAPWQDWAWQALIRARTEALDSTGLYRIYSALLDANPNAAIAKNNVAALGLLLGRDVEKCTRLAREVYLSATNNPTARSTYAFALHVEGKSAEGLRLLQGLPERELHLPGVATYYAILLAANGQREQAGPFVTSAEKGRILPEERRLLEVAHVPQ